MTKIIIRTIGNRALSRSLYTSIDSETTHRTASGAARRYLAVLNEAANLTRTCGRWGHIEIEINGTVYEDARHDLDQPLGGDSRQTIPRWERLAYATASFERGLSGYLI